MLPPRLGTRGGLGAGGRLGAERTTVTSRESSSSSIRSRARFGCAGVPLFELGVGNGESLGSSFGVLFRDMSVPLDELGGMMSCC